MKLSRNEIIFVGTAVSLIIGFSLLFYFDITRKITATGEQIGTITFKRKVAQRKYASRVVWEELSQDVPIYNNDSLRTAEFSEAVIKLKDGTEIKMDESSMILLSYAKDGLEVDFTQGSIKANRAGVKDADLKALNIKSGDTKITLQKSDVSVNKDMGRELSLMVNKGTARVNIGKDREQEVKEDQKIIATPDDLRVYDINLKLIAPNPHKIFITQQEKSQVDFTWEKAPAQSDIFLELSSTNSFTEILVQRKTGASAETLNLNQGTYYWRVRAVNRLNKKIDYSETRRLSVLRDTPVEILSPARESVIRYREKLPAVSFQWGESELASSYKITIASDREMKQVVSTSTMETTTLTLDTLQPGPYFWQVQKASSIEGAADLLPSAVSVFSIVRTEKVPPPEPMYPPDKKAFSMASLSREPVTFSWKANLEFVKYRLQLSSDPEFKNIMHTEESETNSVRLAKNLGRGRYFWRGVGVLNSGETTDPSKPRSVEVVESSELALSYPDNNAAVFAKDGPGPMPVEFSWKRSDTDGVYQLEISRDENFSSMVKESRGSDFARSIELDQGKYFWRVRLLDEAGTELVKSGARSFTALKNLAAPAAITPVNGMIIDMNDSDSLNFRWNRIEGAGFYRIGIFQLRGGAAVNVAVKETPNTAMMMNELSKLDVGNFYWTLQAFETDQSGKKVLRKSPESKYNFRIKLKELEKPKIISPKILILKE